MTKYLNPQPFSAPVSPGNLTAEEYFLRVGALVRCEECGRNVSPSHKCYRATLDDLRDGLLPLGSSQKDQYEPT